MENIRTYRAGEIIFRQDTYEGRMYDLLSGTVGIYINYGEAQEKKLTQLHAEDGVCFGEMGMVQAMVRSATAVALTDVEAAVITGEDFGTYFEDKPEKIIRVMQQMSSRTRALTEDYLEVCRTVAELEATDKKSWSERLLSRLRLFRKD